MSEPVNGEIVALTDYSGFLSMESRVRLLLLRLGQLDVDREVEKAEVIRVAKRNTRKRISKARKTGPVRYSDELVARCRADHARGLSFRRVATLHGIAHGTVMKMVKRTGAYA